MSTELLSFLYLYTVGGLLFVGGLWLGVKRGAVDLQDRHGRRTVIMLLGGYAAYILFHALTQFVLPGMGGSP